MVIPFHDVNPARRTPWVTRLLIAANVVVFLLTPAVTAVGLGTVAVADLCQAEAFFYQYGAVPAELVTNAQLPRVPTGEAVGGACLLGPPAYEKTPVWSVLSAMFLHAGWLHLLGNLLFLYVFGNNVEDRFGHVGFLAFYLGAGYVASYGFALGFPDTVTPMVGASGAVSGVLGAYLALYPHARVWSLVPVCLFLPLRLPAWLVLGSWFVLQYLYSIGYGATDGTVAYLAHVVGFVFGFLVALPWRRPRPRPHLGPPPPRSWGWGGG
ncbi:MAG TPA: rhomboid family intramembrane serine protease [Natronosporangium sp.]|nr:rhomboid family intramembrane serine protease [Natronosporangium sp.]